MAQLQSGTHLPSRERKEHSISFKTQNSTRFRGPTVQHLQLSWGTKPLPEWEKAYNGRPVLVPEGERLEAMRRNLGRNRPLINNVKKEQVRAAEI